MLADIKYPLALAKLIFGLESLYKPSSHSPSIHGNMTTKKYS